MEAREGSVIGRTIWTVWGYLSGAVARYLRPEVTDEGNQTASSSIDDTVFRNTTKVNRQVKENDAEKEEAENQHEQKTAEVKGFLSETKASAQWEKTDVVKKDNNELQKTTAKPSYHCAMWCAETDQLKRIVEDGHKLKGEMITVDVQMNNERKQTKSEAHSEKEASSSTECEADVIYSGSQDNIDFKGSETEQKLKELEDIEQKDGKNEDTKAEEYDHYDEDGGEMSAMRREDSDGTEVTSTEVQPELGQNGEQEKQTNKMDCVETEDVSGTEYTRDLIVEKMFEYVSDEKKQIVVHRDQEKTENDEDKRTESLIKEEDLPELDCSTEDDKSLSKPPENESLAVTKKYFENEDIQTTERQEIELISKNVVKVLEIRGITEQDKNIEEHERCKWLHTSELSTDIFSENEAPTQRLGEIQSAKTESKEKTKSELESVETLPRALEEIFETSNEMGMKTATEVNEVVDEPLNALEDFLPSELSKQDSPETGPVLPALAIETEPMFSDLVDCDCELPGELRKGPEIGSVHTGALDQITTVATSFGSLEEMTTNLNEPHTEKQSLREAVLSSEELELKGTLKTSSDAFEQDTETPILFLESCTKEIQTLKEMAKVSLKECVQLRNETVETMKTEILSHEKAEVFMTESQTDNEILELNTEDESTLSPASMDPIRESLKTGECESSVKCEMNRSEVHAEDSPDVGGLISSLSPAAGLEETLDLQGKYEQSADGLENREADETEALKTTVEGLEEIMNPVLKENLIQEIEALEELSTETLCDAKIQSAAECLQTGALVREGEGELSHDTGESWAEMEVETVISEAVRKQKDEHKSNSPECEADGGCGQIIKDTVTETHFHSHDDIMAMDKPALKRRFDDVSKDLPEVKVEEQKAPGVDCSTTDDLDVQPFMDSSLDFSVQKSRIAVKNPLVRPPKDPRKLLYRTSVEPSLPKPPACGLLKGRQAVAVSVQSKGIIGFKLPGLVTELPTLRKTEFGKKAREGGAAESRPQEEQKSEADTENSVKQEQASYKPKWTPPKHPGMGSPLMMAELKNKLKPPVKD